jgi:site-specific DNA-methyltransferase (adenine-specific)
VVTPFYKSDGITIYCGDALEVLPEIDRFDALVTDPPYSSGGQFRSDRMRGTVDKYVNSDTAAFRPEFSGDNRDQRAFYAWSALWLSFAASRADVGAHAFVFTDWRQLPTVTDAIQAGGWVWRGLGTWWKPGIRMQRGGLSQSAEYVVWGTLGAWSRELAHSPQNVCKVAPVGGDDKLHIAEKPEAVLEWLVPFAPAGGIVLDPFMGAGTTLVAAKRAGRQAIGVDILEENCAIAVKRLTQGALFTNEAPEAAPERVGVPFVFDEIP